MVSYALVAYFDKETENKFKRLWQHLSEKDITYYGIENK